jgi:hypothetical protein
MAVIKRYKTISVINSFEKGIIANLKEGGKELSEPEYKEIIPANLLRRMSKVLRMGVGCGLAVALDEKIEGVIVGSGIGCYQNSITFTEHYLNKPEGALSPTAFIQSTDNAIAGQIAIALGNNAYNNTYIHKGIAFENALVDALLLLREGKNNILVGAVDEWIRIYEHDNTDNEWIGEGSSFFLLTTDKKVGQSEIVDCWVLDSTIDEVNSEIKQYLDTHSLELPDLVLAGNSFIGSTRIDHSSISKTVFRYDERSGTYFTNSAFALHLASEIIDFPEMATEHGLNAGSVLIINNFNDELFGIIYVKRV